MENRANIFKSVTIGSVLAVLARRALLFIAPVVISVATLFAYASHVKLFRSEGIVLFNLDGITTDDHFNITPEFEEKKHMLVSSLVYGEPVRKLISRAWPTVQEADDPARYHGRAQGLRSKNGLKLQFRRDNYHALSVSYTSTDPTEAFRVSKAAIDTLLELNHEQTEKRLTTNIAFLKKELLKSRESLKNVEEKLLRVKAGLPASLVQKHEKEQAARIQKVGIFPVDLTLNDVMSGSTHLSSTVPELKFNLKIVEKEYERLQKQLEEGSYLDEANEIELLLNVSDDPVINRTAQSIVDKEQERDRLIVQGYRPAHPIVAAVDAEIKTLSSIKEKRLQDLQSAKGSSEVELAKLKLEQRLRGQAQAKATEIQAIKDKMNAIEALRDEALRPGGGLDNKLSIISGQKAKLLELEAEKYIAADSYNQIAKRLEVAQRETRVEEESIGMELSIIEEPKLPAFPLPMAHLSLILVGLLGSVGFSVGLAYLIATSDTTLRSSEDLRDIVELPVLGSINRMTSQGEIRKERIFQGILLASLVVYVLCADLVVRTFII